MKNNGFTTRKIRAQTLGEKLIEARNNSKISLDNLAESLNIRKSYLEALEKGDYENLPADVYVRGYLKHYCEYFGLNYQELLKLYCQERGIEEQLKKAEKKDQKRSFKSTRIVITPRMIRIGLVIVVVFSLFFYIWYQISGLARPPYLNIIDPSQDKTIKDDVITMVGQTDPEASLFINDQPIYIDKDGNFKERIGLQKGVNILKVVARSRLGKESVIERKIIVKKEALAANEIKKNSEENQIKKEKEEGVKLIVMIENKATWIRIKEDGKIVYSGTMLPDSSQTFEAKKKITLSSGKANTTHVIFNGKDLGLLGKTSEPIREMEFSRNLITE